MERPGERAWKIEDVADLVGMSEADARSSAKQRGLDLRVYFRDDDVFGITTAHVPQRINVAVRNGVVVRLLHFG